MTVNIYNTRGNIWYDFDRTSTGFGREGEMMISNSGKKRKNKQVQKAGSYYALKSKNEIYYQMASIFKEVATDDNKMAEVILSHLFSR